MSDIIELTDTSFTTIVPKSKGYMLIDFWAPWCGPCRQLAPTLHQISQQFSNVKVAKVNIDENKNIASIMGVRGIPALFLFKDGKRIDQRTGGASYTVLEEWLLKHTGE